MNINKFTNFLESKYPLRKSEEWDNCGLLLGDKRKTVNNVVIALDLTTEVMEKAIAKKADLIITHHPFIFGAEKEETKERFIDSPYKESIYQRAINTDMGVYALHTNFDSCSNGMSDAFIETLGFKPKKIPKVVYGKSFEANLTHVKLEKLITKKIGITKFASNADREGTYQRIAVLPGSGSIQEIIAASKAGSEVIITSDIKWNEWLTIKELNINVIEIAHAMEDVFTHKINELLKNKFKGINTFPIFTKEIAK